MNKPKQKSRFWVFLLALFLVGLAAGAFLLNYLWDKLEIYQKTTPQYAILQSIQQLQAGNATGEVPSQLLPNQFATQADYWRAAAAQTERLHTEYDALRFYSGGQVGETRYTVLDGEIKVEFLLLAEGSGWQAWPVVSAEYSCTVQAPAGVSVFADGVLLAEQAQPKSEAVAGFEEAKTQPEVLTYQLTELFAQPTLEVSCDWGICEIVWSDETAAQITVYPIEAQQTELYAFFEKVAKVYANFVSQDATFAQLSPHLLPDTTFYKNLRGFDNSWYVTHDSVVFENFTLENLVMEGQGLASAEASFDYIVKKEGLSNREYPSHYRLCAARNEDGWKLLNLQIM